MASLWDGAGNVVRTDGTRTGIQVWANARDANVNIVAAGHDTHDQGLADSIEKTLNRDGENAMAADLRMDSNKIVGLNPGTLRTDAVRVDQVQDGDFMWGGTAGGTADALTLTLSPAITTYSAGLTVRFVAGGSANTGATTVAINGLAAQTIQTRDGSALVAGDIPANSMVEVIHDGTNFRFLGGIDPDEVTTAKIEDGSINDNKISSITGANIGVGSVPTNRLTEDNGITQGMIDSNAVGQDELKSSSGEVSTTTINGETLILPGGQHGFYPRIKSRGGNAIDARISGEVGGGGGTDSSTYVTAIMIGDGTSGGVDAFQRFVTSSPPFDLGDGDVQGFLFLIMRSGQVAATYSSAVPPWAYNGPTDIRGKLDPETGKKYRRVPKSRSLIAQLREGKLSTDACRERLPEFQGFDLEEITQETKNRDMPLIPHPFASAQPTDTVVLLDPMDELVGTLLEAQNAGDPEVTSLITSGRIKPDNETLRRKGPPGVMQCRIKS